MLFVTRIMDSRQHLSPGELLDVFNECFIGEFIVSEDVGGSQLNELLFQRVNVLSVHRIRCYL